MSKLYLDKIKDKYQINSKKKSKYYDTNDYNLNQRLLHQKLKRLFPECADELFEQCKKYRLLEICEDPEIDTFVKCFMKLKGNEPTIRQGVVTKYDPLAIYIQSKYSSYRISRHHMILGKYSSGQLSLFNMQKYLNKSNNFSE